MSGVIHSFDFLEEKEPTLGPFVLLVGDEVFLKQLVRQKILASIGSDDGVAILSGDSAEWSDVTDELSTLSLFGDGPRVVYIENGNDFVTNYRSKLEAYCLAPITAGQLFVDIRTLASNTKLYTAAAEHAVLVDCRLPKSSRGKSVDETRAKKWLQQRAKRVHQLKLDSTALDLLVDLVGLELGLLDQDFAKLALFVEPNQEVTTELIQRVVGGWRQQTIWELMDAAASGNAANALTQLDHWLHSGEHPIALFGSLSWSFRRFAAATRVVQRQEKNGQRVDLTAALLEAGFRKWPPEQLTAAKKQLRQIGRDRAVKIHQWLLELDVSLKGSHATADKARFAVERFILQLAKRN